MSRALLFNNYSVNIEQGIWTPTFICLNGTDPTCDIEYTKSHYYRIGDLVYITFFIHYTVSDVGSGSAYISGLPFIGTTDTDRQGIQLTVRGQFSGNTVLTVTENSSIIKIGLNDGGDQQFSAGEQYIGGSGCYLTK